MSNKVFNRFYYKSLIISQKKKNQKQLDKVKETTYFSSAQLTKYIRTKASYKIIDNIYKTYIIHYNVLINKNEKKKIQNIQLKGNQIAFLRAFFFVHKIIQKVREKKMDSKNTNFENKSLLRVVFFL